MMRLFWRIILLALALLTLTLLWLTLQPASWFVQRAVDQQFVASQPKDMRVSLAYELESDQWVSFPLQADDELLKVISNAVIPVDHVILDEERWEYGIEYQVVDKDDQVILSGDIFHKTGQKIFYDEISKQRYVATSFFPSLSNPLDARLHIINLRGYQHVEKLQLRSKYKQSAVTGIIARVYHEEKFAEHKLKYMWQRMGDEKRKYLAKASVYEQDLLREQEKQLLMQEQWAHLGPLGASEKDYIARKLYIAREVENDVVTNLPVVPPSGLVVYADRYGIVKIPVFPGMVKLTWQSMDDVVEDDAVKIQWWGHPATRYKHWQRSLSSGEFIQKLDSGVLQLSATKQTVFRVWINQDKQPVEITPATKYLRLYRATEQPVIYSVNHLSTNNTQLRFDARSFIDMGAAQIEYRLLDKDRQIVKQGMIETSAVASQRDTVTADKYRTISHSQSFFFNLPPEINSIELYSQSEVWISAYTRPTGMGLSMSYPYQQDDSVANRSNMPAWYLLRPAHWKDYVAEGRSLLLSVQSSAPDIDPLIMAGQFRWDQFLPEGNWRGRELLTPVIDGLPYREQSLANRYVRIKPAVDTVVDLKVAGGQPVISPQLMYLKDDRAEADIKLWLDNTLLVDEKVFASDGELSLPSVTPGRHTLRVESSQQAELLLDHVAKDEGAFIKKMAIKLDEAPLTFSYLKEHDEELIAIRIYSKQTHDQVQKIQLDISGIEHRSIGPFTSWTVAERLYHLDKTDGAGARVLKDKDPQLGPARLFFVSLGDDLPNGKTYQVNMKLVAGPAGYVILTRTLPGVFESRLIRNEKTPAE